MGTYDTRGGTPRHDPMFDYDPPCAICGKDPSGDCDCPECPKCGTVGDPKCYIEHGLKQPEGLKGIKCPACDRIFNQEPIEEGWSKGNVTCPFCESSYPKAWAMKLERFESERATARKKMDEAETEDEIKKVYEEWGSVILKEFK